MRQIILLEIGQCGNHISNDFWQKVATQHGIDTGGRSSGSSDLQLQKIDAYFNETRSDHNLSRSVLSMTRKRSNNYAHLYNPDNYIYHDGYAGNLWAKGYYTEGREIIEHTLEAVRREAEGCQNLEAVQLVHSLGGGTGLGFGSLLLQRVKELYPDKITETISIFPSAKVSDNVLEVYNTTLATPSLVENSNLSVMLDNQGLLRLCQERLKIGKPTYSDLNSLVSSAMCGLTASTRFPGQLNASLRKVSVNSVPFPRMHFFMNLQVSVFNRSRLSERNYSGWRRHNSQMRRQKQKTCQVCIEAMGRGWKAISIMAMIISHAQYDDN